MLESELLVGTVGWNHDDWVGGFYPDDLPDDWRFGYYTNRLRALLVPADHLEDPQVDPAAWNDDLFPGFRLVVEWRVPVTGSMQSAQALLERCTPVLDNIDAWLVTLAAPADAETVSAIELLASRRPVCLGGENNKPLAFDISAVTNATVCWQADREPRPQPGGRFMVALTGETNPRTVRDMIDKIDAWAKETGKVTGAALFFSGNKAAETALQARTIAELMGV